MSGFSYFNALSMETVFADAAVWVADAVQTNLAGYDFVQWPSRGRHLLVPRLRDGEPVWMDPHGDVTISRIGGLCKKIRRIMHQRSPVQIAQLYVSVASALVGGVVAAYAVAESRVDDFSFSDAGVISVVITPQWAGATAAVVAAVGVALLHRWGRGGLASVFAVVGALAIALPAFVPVSAQISVTLNAIGAGAFLAAAAFPTKGHRGAQTALGLGVTTTTLYFGAADLWRDRVPRWSLTLPGDSYPVPSTVPVWILLAATLLVGGVAALARPNQEPGDIDAAW